MENNEIIQKFSKLSKMAMIAIIAIFIANIINAQTEQPVFLENINSLEEAIKPLYGKKIYLDLWATWCSPCVDEFRHNEALKKNLAENDIQQLYISFDRDYEDERWKQAIKSYNLTGTHIRANEKLTLDLFRLIYSNRGVVYEKPSDVESDLAFGIPRYVLIDEKGNIMNKSAIRPNRIVAGEKLW